MTKLKNSNFDKTKKTQIDRKIKFKNKSYFEQLNSSNCINLKKMKATLKNQIARKLKILDCDKTNQKNPAHGRS